MAKPSDSPKSLAEAIEKLESVGQSKTKEFKDLLEKDYQEILRALDDLKPYLDDVRKNVETEVSRKKNEVEVRVKENPWLALGIVGVIAFFIGWLIGGGRKD